ncbi:MAG: VWA domain-containing protein [Phycisphaerae bacterium]|nr:VWA domain-containing protein [Phycisphaerae bacterium]
MTAALGFTQPWALAALVVVTAPPLIAVWARRRGRHVGRLSVALQSAALALGVCALARPTMPLGPGAAKPYLLLRDVSGSVRGQHGPDWPADLPVRRHVFAAQVAPSGGDVDASTTHIGAPLRLATAQSDQIAGVVIVTDGNFQDAQWSAAADTLGQTGLPVAVVPLTAPGQDACIAALAAERPPSAPAGHVRLRATLTASADQTRRVSLRRNRPDERIFPPRRVDLSAGGATTVTLTDSAAPTDADAVYEVRLLGRDAFAENDVRRVVAVGRRRRVAWIAPDGYRREGLAAALGADVDVEHIAPAAAPVARDGWDSYAAVVLVDATGRQLDADQRRALAAYVRAGGGLLHLGSGPHRTPADRDDPLNAVAALTARPYERTPLKVIVALDASGSMGAQAGAALARGRRKFDLAGEAIMALEAHLMSRDALAVVTFAARPHVIYDSGPARPDFAAVHDALGEVRPAGQTDVLPALGRAVQLAPSDDRQTLVILVSDLLDEAFEPRAAAALFSGDRHLAMVVAGPADDPRQAPLRALADRLDAPLRTAADLGDLDELFVEFLQQLRGKPLRRGRFALRAEPSAVIGAAPEDLSPLTAYIVSQRQPGADVLARVAPSGDPVLARRRVGLGMAISLATDLPALTTPDAPLDSMLATQTRAVLRPPRSPGLTVRVRRDGATLHVRLRAVRPDRLPEAWPLDGLNLVAAAADIGTDGAPREARLVQIGPGRYSATLPVGQGPQAVTIRRGDEMIWRGAADARIRPEFQSIGADRDALRRLAERTGGRITAPGELPTLARRWGSADRRPICAHVLLVALAVMLVDWAVTRIRRQ